MEHLSLPGVALLPMLTAGLMLSVLTGCSPLRSYEALLILSDIGAANAPRTPTLIKALPPEMGADIAALNLANKDLRRLKARLILIHGKNDAFIPYPESLALAHALPPRQARAYVINRILGHVDLRFSHLLSWQFVRRDLPDVWRMHRAVSALLAERTAV